MPSDKRFSATVKCGHCGNSAPMEIVSLYSQVAEYEADDPRVHVRWQAGDIYELLLCPACNQVTLRSTFYHDGYDEEIGEYRILYPTDETAPDGLPQPIARAYDAARKVRSIDANAFAVLLGRVLELVCEDRQASGRDLNAKLENLASRGEIPTKLVSVSHGLRHLRNVGAHAVLGELTSGEAPILDALTRAILEYVYSAPLLAEKAAERLEQLRQARTTRSGQSPGTEEGAPSAGI